MSYQAVLFDMDGTLLDTLDDLWGAVNATMRRFGVPEHSREDVRRFVGNGVNRLLELALPGGLSDPHFDEAVAAYRAYYAAHSLEKTKPYAGVPELVRNLTEAGVVCAVVSNKPDISTKKLASIFFPEIAAAIGEDEAAGIRRKPAPDMVLAAVRELGADPSRCVYVGDSEVDLETGRRAGMDVISVLWGFRDEELLREAGAERFARTPEELFGLIMSDEM